ncbi:uncharacterized protein KY384_005872 [Bacidia gigantensis]|uniref:uncharacterized protein n=1 Tax=Bacidia gigantensis TaxID=2732470 RepID=UPI001D0521BF|nr:uncharacterized protein KY384_005872 [Bacidia gigantensis]KAG8529237.1 hypothetical protein KY384_005872 [Bacidia gigantensis]
MRAPVDAKIWLTTNLQESLDRELDLQKTESQKQNTKSLPPDSIIGSQERAASDVEPGESSDDSALAESRDRRLLELKLMHQYSTSTFDSLLVSTSADATEIFQSLIPALALKNDALLYSLYALASLHLAALDPDNPEVMDAHRSYLDRALQAHFQDISNLNQDNADAACTTSSVLRIATFSMLRDRLVIPYTVPFQWLKMTHDSKNIFIQAWEWIKNEDSLSMRMICRPPAMTMLNKELYEESNRESLKYLLEPHANEFPSGLDDIEVRVSYEAALSLLGGVQIAIDAGQETAADICRRVIVFPILVPDRFIKLVEESQPRALVIFAHFFALLVKFRNIWWIQDTGRREIEGIQSALPDGWQHLMTVPLRAIEEYRD